MTRLSPDDRFALAAAAANAERSNRPRHLLLAGAAVLAVGLLVAAAGFVAQARAAARLARAERELDRVQEAAVAIVAARNSGPVSGDFPPPPIADFIPRMERLYRQAGLTGAAPIPQDRSEARVPSAPEIVERSYTYNAVRSQDLSSLLRWVELALREFPGARVSQISVESNGGQWVLGVVFSRWERRADR